MHQCLLIKHCVFVCLCVCVCVCVFRLGRVSDCESVSPALVQMKETTGALERKEPDKT